MITIRTRGGQVILNSPKGLTKADPSAGEYTLSLEIQSPKLRVTNFRFQVSNAQWDKELAVVLKVLAKRLKHHHASFTLADKNRGWLMFKVKSPAVIELEIVFNEMRPGQGNYPKLTMRWSDELDQEMIPQLEQELAAAQL